MKKILREVAHSESEGSLGQFNKLLAGKDGHYWLHQLDLLMRKELTHTFEKSWLEDLDWHFTWLQAKHHFRTSEDLWYNEPDWPFQICVLEIGGKTRKKFREEWQANKRFEEAMVKHIDDLPWKGLKEKKEILLIRLQPRLLGIHNESDLPEINCAHPDFNLLQCPPETAFFMRPLVKEYFDKKPTLVAMNFRPQTMADRSKQRVFHFNLSRGYGNNLYMHVWDLAATKSIEPNSWWIFQYELKPKED